MRLFVGLARNPLDSCLARPPRGNNRVYIVRDSVISPSSSIDWHGLIYSHDNDALYGTTITTSLPSFQNESYFVHALRFRQKVYRCCIGY
jgi:hypothetical protein